MDNNILRAEVAIVSLGDRFQFEGLKLEDGQYAIAQQQVASLFSVMATSAPEWLERKLGKGFQLWKVKTNRPKQAGKQNRLENAISLPNFRKLIRILDKQGNKKAELIADILCETMLEQFFADALGIAVTAAERQAIANRVMDAPKAFHPLFGDENMNKIASFLKVGRNHPKLANWMWTFVYHTLTSEEIAKLNRLNPIQPNGHRKQTIHQWLEKNATDEHKRHFDMLLMIVKAAPSEQEFEDLYRRLNNGGFQGRLFDF